MTSPCSFIVNLFVLSLSVTGLVAHYYHADVTNCIVNLLKICTLNEISLLSEWFIAKKRSLSLNESCYKISSRIDDREFADDSSVVN